MDSLEAKNIFSKPVDSDNNKIALSASREFYSSQNCFKDYKVEGSYFNEDSSICLVGNEEFIFPKNCEYFCVDVRILDEKIPLNNQFDFILMDPPWWNKSIRRKKAKFIESR